MDRDRPGWGDQAAGENPERRAEAAIPAAAPLEGPPIVDPTGAAMHRGPDGSLRLQSGARCWLHVSCYRAFPMLAPDAWIVFFDGDEHVGVLEDLSALDAVSAAICREELELRYVVPAAVGVAAIREEYGESEWNPAQVWDFLTDRGPLRLHLPNLADHVRPVGAGRLLFTDRDERRCLLTPAAIDARSRALVARYLWLEGIEER